MLEQVLRHLNNYFVVKDGVHADEYEISSGALDLDFLQENLHILCLCLRQKKLEREIHSFDTLSYTPILCRAFCCVSHYCRHMPTIDF